MHQHNDVLLRDKWSSRLSEAQAHPKNANPQLTYVSTLEIRATEIQSYYHGGRGGSSSASPPKTMRGHREKFTLDPCLWAGLGGEKRRFTSCSGTDKAR